MSPAAFFALLTVATPLGGNVVAARLALDNGVGIVTVVAVRSLVTAAAVALLVAVERVPMSMTARQRRVMPLICVLSGVRSVALYAAVARLPVGLAVLSFNSVVAAVLGLGFRLQVAAFVARRRESVAT